MKTKEVKEKYQKMTKKQKKIIAALSGFVILMGIALGIYVAKEYEENKVSAHPTSVITLDPGGTNEFKVPVDDTSIIESALSSYTGYVQGTEIVPVLLKNHVEAFASDIINSGSVGWSVRSVEETNYGHYFVLFSAGGENRGGLIKVSVYDKSGNELATNISGTLANGVIRVNAPLFHASNNNYLILGGSSFFRYTVSGETATTATITQTALTVPNTAATELKVHLIQKVDTFSTYSDNSVVSGPVYGSHAFKEGYVKNRIPIGTISTSGWLSTGFSGSVVHQYSLENLLHSELGLSIGVNEYVSAQEQYLDSAGNIYGYYLYSNSENDASVRTIQIFSQVNVIDPYTGSQLKQREYVYTNSNIKAMYVLKELCTTNEMYFLSQEATDTKLIKVDLNTYADQVVKVYPQGTILAMFDNGDGTLSYYGTTTSLTGDFYSNYYSGVLSSSHYFVQGIMNDATSATPFDVKSIRAFEIAGEVNPLHVKQSSATKLFVAGTTYDFANFTDDLYMVQTLGTIGSGTPSSSGAFVGTLNIEDDYAPIIKENQDILVDVSDSDINSATTNSYNWTPMDNWLITGSKTGTMSDTLAVSGYDYFDNNDLAVGLTPTVRQKWLDMRINRNPNNISAAIEWTKLGFDKTTTGPQLVTYFVTDTQNQAGVTSRWANKKTSETIISNDYALDAQNFAVALTDISTKITDEEDFKELAKTMAWDMDNHTIDEDSVNGTFDPAKVTVDATQLATLQSATEAKPYPVDVTYKPDASTTIVNRVWVFVTTKNTVVDIVDGQNGVVIYADDYTLPLHQAQTETKANVYDHANVKVYNYYDNSNETAAVLPTIADKSNATDLDVLNLNVITGATGATVVQPQIEYTWSGGKTVATPDVTITAQVLMHVRQVVFSSTSGDLAELVIPSEGYLQLVNTSTRQLNLVVDSGEESTNPAFKEVYTELDDAGGNDKLDFDVIVPEYYEYKGYVVTNTAGGHSSTLMTAGTYQYDLTSGNYEQWITVYVTPKLGIDGSPKPYAWDYKLNDFGTIDAD